MTARDAPTLDELRRRLPHVRARLREYTGDMPSSDGGSGSGVSDRTSRIATTRDAARQAEHELDTLMARALLLASQRRPILALVWRIDRLMRAWELSENQADGLRGDTEGKGEPGCASCSRVKDSLNRPLWSPLHPGLKVCRSCHHLLGRQRALDGHHADQLVSVKVLTWLQHHPSRYLSEDKLRSLVDGT